MSRGKDGRALVGPHSPMLLSRDTLPDMHDNFDVHGLLHEHTVRARLFDGLGIWLGELGRVAGASMIEIPPEPSPPDMTRVPHFQPIKAHPFRA
jgi:hypothetical protein